MARRKILLCDDSALVRSVVAHALGALDLDVTTIEDPRELAAEVARLAPDILLVDLTYPTVNDDELVALIVPHVKTLPVFLFSDRRPAELAALVERTGARGAVPKDAAVLVDQVRAFFATVT